MEDSGPKLVIVHGEGPRTTFVIPEGEVVIGSGHAAHIPLQYEGVSRRHAVLNCNAGEVTINDLGSLNGTWINGRKIGGPTLLHNNDLLQVGRIKARIYCNDAISRVSPVSSTRNPPSTIGILPSITDSTATNDDITEDVQLGSRRRIPAERGVIAPWYRRSRRILIGAGTAAAALGSIFALLDRADDAADLATIESVSIAKRTALADFPTESLGKNLSLSRDPNAANQRNRKQVASLSRIHIEAAAPALLPRASTQQAAPTTPSPTRSGSPPGSSTKPTPTVTSTPTSTTSPSGISTSTPSGSTSTPSDITSTSTASKIEIPALPSDEYLAAVQEQLLLNEMPPELDDIPPEAFTKATKITTFASEEANGQPISPARVAEELKKALTEVELESVSQPTDDYSQPMGWTVGVGLELKGLANVPLVLTWSLDGVDVSATWRAENLAYKIVASTEHDGGIARIWVPDLKRTGAYNVNVTLSYEATETIAAAGHLQLPDN